MIKTRKGVCVYLSELGLTRKSMLVKSTMRLLSKKRSVGFGFHTITGTLISTFKEDLSCLGFMS